MRSEARSIGFSCGFFRSRFARRQRINYAQGCCCCWAVAGEEVGSFAHQSVKSALQSHSSNWVRVSRDVAPGVAASQSPFPSPSPSVAFVLAPKCNKKKARKKSLPTAVATKIGKAIGQSGFQRAGSNACAVVSSGLHLHLNGSHLKVIV